VPVKRLVKRVGAVSFLTFVDDVAYLSADEDDAAVFGLTADGRLVTGGGVYVGTDDVSTGTAPLLEGVGRPPDAYEWAVDDGTLQFGNTTFLVLVDQQLLVDFGGDSTTLPDGAIQVSMAPEFVAATGSSSVLATSSGAGQSVETTTTTATTTTMAFSTVTMTTTAQGSLGTDSTGTDRPADLYSSNLTMARHQHDPVDDELSRRKSGRPRVVQSTTHLGRLTAIVVIHPDAEYDRSATTVLPFLQHV
jgi:hypothetical protein